MLQAKTKFMSPIGTSLPLIPTKRKNENTVCFCFLQFLMLPKKVRIKVKTVNASIKKSETIE